MATYPELQGFDLNSVLQAANLGKMLNPENIQREALGNQLALQLQQVQLQRAQQNLNDALHPEIAQQRSLNFLLAQENAKNPFSGLNVTPGGQIVQNPGALLPEQVAALESGTVTPEALNVPRGTPTIPIQGVNGPLEYGRSLDSMLQAGLNERKYNRTLSPPIHGTPGTTFFDYNPETDTYRDVASVAQKGNAQLRHGDAGNRIAFFDDAGNEVRSIPKAQDARYEIRKEGVYVEQTPGKGDFKFTAATPTQASSTEQYQADLNDRALKAIESLKARTNDNTVGRASRLQGAKYFPDVLQTDEFVNYKSDLDSLKSQFFLAQVAEMKANSKTGATGLGPVSDREGKRLESAMASIDQNQSPANMKKNLDIAADAIKKYDAAKKKFLGSSNTPIATPTPTPTGGGKKKLSSTNNFPSEEAARSAGFGNGSIVIINGQPGELH